MIVHHSAAKALTVVIVVFCDLSNFYVFIFLVGGWVGGVGRGARGAYNYETDLVLMGTSFCPYCF